MHGLLPNAETYVCPGQTHSISRAVHLARLAASYPACHECAFRDDQGSIAIEAPNGDSTPSARKSIVEVTADGFRGRHRNELDRKAARQLTAAFASLIWETGDRDRLPAVAVGFDQRPSSPDILAGVVDALKQMGCGVIDIGPASYPQFAFLATQIDADAGVLITGAGCDPSWTGLDLWHCGAPVGKREVNAESSPTICLDDVLQRSRQKINRPSRRAGRYRIHRDNDSYLSDLRDEFHALRPVDCVVAVGSQRLRNTVESLFTELPCRLTLLDLPVRRRDLTDSQDGDVVRMSEIVASGTRDVGFAIDEDARTCAAFDETGELITVDALSHLIDAGRSNSSGRYWLTRGDGNARTCDAMLTLARLLAAMSMGDVPISELVGKIAKYMDG